MSNEHPKMELQGPRATRPADKPLASLPGTTQTKATTMTNRGLYVIIDHVANDMVGIIQAFRAEAAAVRFFTDVAMASGTAVNKHPNDHSLVRLGWLNDDLTVAPDNKTILDGSAWATAQQRSQENNA